MANPILPLWEYIPDGEPRVFGDRIYLYGSHDRPGCEEFCDFKLKCWSAPVDDPTNWICHGHIFHTRPDSDHPSDTSEWTERELYAPDVVEKDGKYYLFMYIVGSKGCVAVADRPEGPFKLLGRYNYKLEDAGDDGIYNDPGVLVDDDGRVFIFYGFTYSKMNEIDGKTMIDIIPGSLKHHAMDDREEIPDDRRFYEASSPRKINGKYYLIYSPRRGSRLAYAIAEKPEGPYEYKGYIIDNGVDFPGGNNHGSLACIKGQWYIFYHRMTNNSIMSRRACVEKVTILPDGAIPTVEMTSLGFEDALNPYRPVKAEIACVLKNGPFITEHNLFERVITEIHHDSVIGYKYFDFGHDDSSLTYELALKVRGMGVHCNVDVYADGYGTQENPGTKIGTLDIGLGDDDYRGRVKALTGRHAIYFVAQQNNQGWTRDYFAHRPLFELEEFVFLK